MYSNDGNNNDDNGPYKCFHYQYICVCLPNIQESHWHLLIDVILFANLLLVVIFNKILKIIYIYLLINIINIKM